jgi:hypothetical protein
MANADLPLGFTPYRHLGGGLVRANAYKLQSGYSTALFEGDACVLTSGYVNRAADNSSVILGVIGGFKFSAADGSAVITNQWVASAVTLNSQDVEVLVYDDPMITYRCQSDHTTAYVDATHKGGSFDVQLDHAGSTTSGRSGMEIDLNDTGTGQFQVIGLIDEPGNAAGLNAKLEVMVRKSLLKQN